MNLHTKIAFPSFESKIDYTTKATFLGSCFSDNIGGWLNELKFDAQTNVCGITYNPISIAKHIANGLNGDMITESDLLLSRNANVHPDFHSSFAHADSKKAVDQINNAIQALGNDLRSSSFLFLTFGTSIAFKLKQNGEIVNNCHHLPASSFTKRLLDEDEMMEVMSTSFDKLLGANPNLKIILTVSPIRHLRHGAIENNRSKSRLVRLCEMLEEKYLNTSYFPVFEFVMDELRDYRFYRQDDFIHLNELGIEMIREKFTDFLISKDAYSLMNRIKKWRAMKAHKILNPTSSEAIEFLQKIKLEEVELEKLLGGRF